MEEEEKKQEEKEKTLNEKVIEKVEEKITKLLENGIQSSNVDYIYKLVDIHKDLKNEEYWKKKEETMMYNYGRDEYGEGSYGRRGVPGTGRGRYSEGSYGRRGVPGTGRGRYRGDYVMEEMREHYMNYSDTSDEAMRGNYGAEGEMIKSVEGIMKNIYEIVEEISETDTPEVQQIIKKYSRKISEM